MKNELLTRAYLVAFALTLFALLVLAQTFRIGVQEADYWKQREQETHVQMRTQKAPRGNILAADGSYLATSQFQYDLHFDPNSGGLTRTAFDEGIDSLAYYISLNINPNKTPDSIATELRAAREKGGHYYPLVKKASHERFREMQTWPILRRGRIRGGFGSHSKDTRQHHYGMMAQRTIGYAKDDSTSVGIEGYFDDILAGEEVKVAHQLKASGRWEPFVDISDLNLESGMDIQTTLEVTVQDNVQQVLRRAVQKAQAEYGVVVVMECKTGAIRALSSLTRYRNGSISESYNHAVGTRVEPGSTFKLASILALFDDKKIKPDDIVRLYNGIRKFDDRDLKDSSPHGLDSTTVRTAFEISSNVGIASLINDLYGNDLAGRTAFVDKLRQFRLGNITDIEIKGESYPLIKDPKKDIENQWSGITLPWMSMGYELELTPLQMTAFYNAIANDGKYVKPRLVDNIQRDGEIVEQFHPVILNNQIASKQAIDWAQEFLEGVVLRGTASGQISNLYRYAGKTGTVQYDYSPEAKRRHEDGHQASFIGYFPVENPRYTIMVLISKPVGDYYGSKVALPVWREIADNLYASDPNLRPALRAEAKPDWKAATLPREAKGSHSDIAEVFASLGIPAFDKAQRGIVELKSPGDTLSVVAYNIPAGRVPDVRGMGVRDAMFLLESKGCRVDVRGRGKVKRQSIKPGTKANGQFVKLTLG